MSDLRPCCQQAALDGFTPEEHARVCREQQPKSEPAATPTTPEEGGQQL